jgi:hypothetical protein
MIRFRVIAVTRKASAEVPTVHYTYEKDERKGKRTEGAEWEEIEFTNEQEEHPPIQVANIAGSTFLAGNPKLIINERKLFGTYKVGDIIEFMPLRIIDAEPSPISSN